MIERNTVVCGDCLEVMQDFPDNSVDAVVTDPPYGLEFMGKQWDHGIPGIPFWQEIMRVSKPGAHLLAFGGTRTHHRLMVAIEDAGWEIRDCLQWLYGSGFPKNKDVSKDIDKRGGTQIAWFGPWFRQWREENGITQKQVAGLFPSKSGGLTGCVANWELGFNMPTPDQFNLIRDTYGLPFNNIEEAEREVVGEGYRVRLESTVDICGRSFGKYDITAPATPAAKQWSGWGTALKPAWEPIILARKPLQGTVAENVLRWGTGAINVDGCRIGHNETIVRTGFLDDIRSGSYAKGTGKRRTDLGIVTREYTQGRWPANLLLDEDAARLLDEQSGELTSGIPCGIKRGGQGNTFGYFNGGIPVTGYGDSGGASRFFYTAKAHTSEKEKHLTGLKKRKVNDGRDTPIDNPYQRGETLRKNTHPTVKPVDLLRYLCRLITPPGGVVLDPFCGSGSTGIAAFEEGFDYIMIDKDPESADIARMRNAQKRIGEFASPSPKIKT